MYEMREPLTDKQQTADRIRELITRFAADLDNIYIERKGKKYPLSSLSLKEYFSFVAAIPYRKDTAPIEVVARPRHIINHRKLGMDCKKKTVLMGSYCELHGLPYRLVCSSRRADKKVHHIFPQVRLHGEYQNIDATYPDNKIFDSKVCTHAELI
jgi:hypothetical protein